MEQLDPESEQTKEVYARFGLAVYQAQCVERQLAILLATKYGPGTDRVTRSQYDELLKSLFRRTSGNLIAHLRKVIDIPAGFEQSLKEALDYRNCLAHNYFWHRAGHFMTEKGRLFMIEELQTVVDFLHDFDNQLRDVVEEWLIATGTDEEMFEAEIKKIENDIVREANSNIQP